MGMEAKAKCGQRGSPDQEDSGTFKALASGFRYLIAPRRCLLTKRREDPIPVHPGATGISSVKDNRRLFDFPASPSTGCACLPAPELLRRAGWDWAQLPHSLEILIICETGSQPRVFSFELGNGSGGLE